MDFKLNNSQSLKLSLSMDMKISIEILKMSSTDLLDFIDNKTKENPCIEVEFSKKKSGKDNLKDQLIECIHKEDTLIDYLEEQIRYLALDRETKNIVIYLINNLDERGYLSFSHHELKRSLKIENKEYLKAITILTTLEPAGVGAVDLMDCLKIQLKRKNITDDILFDIIDNNLEDIANDNLDSLCEIYGITKTQINVFISDIKKLNPKPARGYIVNNKIEYLIPDIIAATEKGKLTISLNTDAIPKLRIHREKGDSKDISSAIALLKSLEKRQDTLLKVSTYILNHQEEYILNNSMMKTLKIKDIAYDLGLHESTISRTIKGKYIKIDGKIRTLKSYILLNSEYEKIKYELEKIIKKEDKLNPYSDEAITKKLEEIGLTVVRRTVTKYREAMRIPSSRGRKKNPSRSF